MGHRDFVSLSSHFGKESNMDESMDQDKVFNFIGFLWLIQVFQSSLSELFTFSLIN